MVPNASSAAILWSGMGIRDETILVTAQAKRSPDFDGWRAAEHLGEAEFSPLVFPTIRSCGYHDIASLFPLSRFAPTAIMGSLFVMRQSGCRKQLCGLWRRFAYLCKPFTMSIGSLLGFRGAWELRRPKRLSLKPYSAQSWRRGNCREGKRRGFMPFWSLRCRHRAVSNCQEGNAGP